MTVTELTNVQRWFVETCEKSNDSLTRLSGENSLYLSYKEFCEQEGSKPVTVKLFAKTVEVLMARYFDLLFTKSRDSKGVYFRSIGMREKPLAGHSSVHC